MVSPNKDKITLIKVRESTREKLKKLKITKRETYDEILNRLMKEPSNK